MTTLENTGDGWSALALAMLNRAKLDAQRGDLGALAWLIVCGADVADSIKPGAAGAVLALCRDALAAMDADRVKTIWNI